MENIENVQTIDKIVWGKKQIRYILVTISIKCDEVVKWIPNSKQLF